MLKMVHSVWTWCVISVVSIAGNLSQMVVAIATWPFDRNKYITGSMFRSMARICVKCAPTWRFSIQGSYPKNIGPCVVVSNHVSNADCFLICLLPWEMKWLGKSSLFKIPFMGWSMWFAGDIPVQRGNKLSITHAMQKCSAYLKRGMPVCIFPEGTRSNSNQHLLPFKEGAFRLALENRVPLIPLAVCGTQEALPKKSWHFGYSKAHVKVGAPIETKNLPVNEDTVAYLKNLAQERIMQLLSEEPRAQAYA
jgi:1-acyl-sn-glycerol-3-phosphate acyltransferase